jgi:hypothetical protein
MNLLNFLGGLAWGATHDPEFKEWRALRIRFYYEEWVRSSSKDLLSVAVAGSFEFSYDLLEIPAEWTCKSQGFDPLPF